MDKTAPLSALWGSKDTHDVDRRIYLLGPGAIGTFVAHQLAGLPDPPPITLLLHRFAALEKWRNVGEQLKVTRYGLMEARKNFDVETMSENRVGDKPKEEIPMIHHLIVTVKAPFTASALERLKHRLDATSTIVFLQNGQGIIDEINGTVFTDPQTRPRYITGTVTHGVYRDSAFTATVRGAGTITLTVAPQMSVEEWEEGSIDDEPSQNHALNNQMSNWPPSARYLMRTICRAPLLRATGAEPWDGVKIALTKLAANAIVNPLTAIFNCRNGELLDNQATSRLMHMLLAEISLVFCSLPETAPIKFRDELYSPQKLRSEVLEVCKNTADNESSMLQDMNAGVQTEIEYINGWIVRRGEELGIKCVVNFTVLQMVNARSTITKNVIEGNLPLEFPRFYGHESKKRLPKTDTPVSPATA